MSNDTRSIIGAKLKAAREYLKISQEEAANVVDIPRSAISLVESGRRKIDMVELMSLAKLYQRPVTYFTDHNFSIPEGPESSVFARKISRLSNNDRKELEQFAEFLLTRANDK